MASIDHLLARSLLLKEPQTPEDTVPYEDTAYPACTLWGGPSQQCGARGPADSTAAGNLRTLCEVVVTHSAPGQLADFITEQLPGPHAAWILGCALHLADVEDGARFWWQYAAGAGDEAAAYLLHLHHLALGDRHAAALWREQTSLEINQETDDGNGVDTSIPTVLRVLSHLTSTAERSHTEAATAVMNYVAEAVLAGYDRHPDCEIPLPGAHFAARVGCLLSSASTVSGSSRPGKPGLADLPNRLPFDSDVGDRPGEAHDEEPEHVLMEFKADDDESASAFREAMAAFWDTAIADLTAWRKGQAGLRLRYTLDRRALISTLDASPTSTTT
ncbi:DUF6207 family protein [Streptomyces sp. NPDC001700]